MAPQNNAAELASRQAQLFGLALGTLPAPHLEPFIYERTLSFAEAAGVGTTADQSIQVEKDADFICTRIAVVCRTATLGRIVGADADGGTEETGAVPDPSVSLLIDVAGQSKSLSDQPVDALAAYGYPFRDLPRPRLIRAGSSMSIRATALKVSAAGTGGLRVRVQFQGYKDYSLPGGR